MSEDLIIKHCSPTLAGLKTANLFTCVYMQKQDVERYAQDFNRRFGCKGVKMLPLEFGKSRALIYVFRPTQLKRDLSDPQAKSILASMGYKCFDSKACLNRLKSRVRMCPAASFFIRETAVNAAVVGRFTAMKKKPGARLPSIKNAPTSIIPNGCKVHRSTSLSSKQQRDAAPNHAF